MEAVPSAPGNSGLRIKFKPSLLQVKQLKPGKAVRIAPAGVDRKPTSKPITGTVTSAIMMGRQCKVTLAIDSTDIKFQAAGLARVWIIHK